MYYQNSIDMTGFCTFSNFMYLISTEKQYTKHLKRMYFSTNMNAFAQPVRNRGIKTLFCIITAWSNYDITVDLCKAGAIQQLRGGKFE